MIFKTPVLGDDELAVLQRIEDLKSSLRYSLQTPRRWTGVLRRNTLARAIRGSNSIEGYNATHEDVVAAVEGEDPFDADTATWAAITGYRQAMTYVLQCATDPRFRISADLLKSLHFMMIGHELPKNPGKWRPGPIFVRDEAREENVYEGPEAEMVPGLIDEFVESMKVDPSYPLPAMVRGAMAHLNLVMIHPFSDANGRMGRCIQTLVLACSGTVEAPFSSIEEYLGRNTRAYCDILAEAGGGSWNPQRDARPWIRFCLTAHFRQASTILRRTRLLEQLWNTLERLLQKAGLNERMLLALADAAIGLRVRNSTYRKAAEVSDQVASRDLKQLVDAGFLVAHGERRGRYYRASQQILDVNLNLITHTPRSIPDPFEDRAQ